MLQELLRQIVTAPNEKEREKVYHTLERVGMDRYTVNVLLQEMIAQYKATHQGGIR